VSAYVTLADICRIYRVSERTARRWAELDQWRRVTSRPVQYRLTDVQTSYDKRRTYRIQTHLARRYGIESEQ